MTDLGERGLPEPVVPAYAEAGTVEAQTPDVKPASEHLPGDSSPAPGAPGTEKKVSTAPRPSMQVPKDVQVNITVDNLKDYVGPAVYHKDRLYMKAPPAGVSTGLGYLGNGSGSVMPIEATVSISIEPCEASSGLRTHTSCLIAGHAWKRQLAIDRKTRRGHPGIGSDCTQLGQVERLRSRHYSQPFRSFLARPGCALARELVRSSMILCNGLLTVSFSDA